MKNILSVVMLFFLSTTLLAQKDVTQFLGIPVDGSKTAMIQKLKAKGYTNSALNKGVLVGKFNGIDVDIHVVTNGDKVYRIMVSDANPINEVDIRIRFNNLCSQFQNNKKYLPLSDYTLSDDEDISYGLSVEKKRYEATYYQQPMVIDSAAIFEELAAVVKSKYPEDQLFHPTEELRKAIDIDLLTILLEKNSNRIVWFMINEIFGKYYITMYYDNGYNVANGEDL